MMLQIKLAREQLTPICYHKLRCAVFLLDDVVVLRVGAAFEHSQSASKASDTAAAAAASSAVLNHQGGARGLLLLVPLMLGLNGKVLPGSPQRGPVCKHCTVMLTLYLLYSATSTLYTACVCAQPKMWQLKLARHHLSLSLQVSNSPKAP